ncbi:MAG TPA: low-specificity L-threonine aldolase [Trueperaceae bacterium]
MPEAAATIDLRSDTVTRPTPAMRRAMAEAPVGDDVYGEDPTVNRLQQMLARMTGFEAGLLMPTGTMSNLAALAVHAQRGSEVIVPAGGHVYEFELGGMAVVSGLIPRPIPAPLGVPEVGAVRSAIHRSIHTAPTGLISLENTHNLAGGTVVPLERCRELTALAREEGLPIHLDGARAFNAAAALGVSIAEVCRGFDSVSICLSKGLAAPVGTVLLGSGEFIREAHRYRKVLGGGMRQAGVIAAAGIVALETMTERLAEDHVRARALAEGLAGLPGVRIDLAAVQTNMVYLNVDGAPRLVDGLAREGILANAVANDSIRLVTHYEIGDADVERTVEVTRRLCERQAA